MPTHSRLIICCALLTGCFTGKKQPPDGFLDVRNANLTPSMCLDGLFRQWAKLDCPLVKVTTFKEGYTQYKCAKQNTDMNASPLLSWEYWVIQYNPNTHQYVKPLSDDVEPICGDPNAIITGAPED